MRNNNKELLEFLTAHEEPPFELSELTRRDVLLSFHGRSIVKKFLFFQVLGALFSLSVCPQFGLGLAEGHGISHVFRMFGDWACALFCGVFFLSSGALVAYIGMKGEELWWIWQRYKSPLMLLPAFFWGALMLTNVTLQLSSESLSYHIVWIAAAIGAQLLWLKLRSGIFVWQVEQHS